MAKNVLDKEQLIIMDGPMGTELQRRGIPTELPLWSARALFDAPDTVVAIHKEYLEAGADLITTNSFRTNSRVVDKSAMQGKARNLTTLSVQLAIQAKEEYGKEDILIVGSDAPVEDCYSPELVPGEGELYTEHREHIERLAESGCDVILIETMNRLREALAAAKAAKDSGVPFFISLVTDPTGVVMLGDDRLENAAKVLSEYEPLAILTNCSSPRAVHAATRVLAEVRRETGATWRFGGYANSGEPDPVKGWECVHTVPIEQFVEHANGMKELGASVLGSCCGATPEYIRALRTTLKSDYEA